MLSQTYKIVQELKSNKVKLLILKKLEKYQVQVHIIQINKILIELEISLIQNSKIVDADHLVNHPKIKKLSPVEKIYQVLELIVTLLILEQKLEDDFLFLINNYLILMILNYLYLIFILNYNF